VKDFLLENRSFIIKLLEFLAAITGLIYYKNYKSQAVKYFIFFLVYVVFLELIGSYPIYFYKIKSLNYLRESLRGTYFFRNYWWYTLFWKIGAVLFYSFYYYRVLEKIKSKTIIKYSGLFFLIISLLYIIFSWPLLFKSWIPLVDIFGGIIILECVFLFFYEILNSDKILIFHKSLTFYISLAILFFWLIKTPLVFYEIYFNVEDINYIEMKGLINISTVFFMYGVFIFGFIICNPKTKN